MNYAWGTDPALVANPDLLDQAKQIRDDVAGQGALARAYAANLDSLGASITRLTNAMDTFKTAVVDEWKPMLKAAIEPLVGMTNFLRENPLAAKLAAWGAALAAGAAGLGVLRFAASMLGWALKPLAPLAAGVIGAFAGMARITTWAYRFAGAAGVIALAGRALLRLTGIGTALWIGSEIIQNWEKLAEIMARVKAMWSNDKPHENTTLPGWMEKARQWMMSFDNQERSGIGPNFSSDGYWRMLREAGIDGAPALNGNAGPVQRNWGAGLAGAAAEQKVHVTTTLSPIQVQAPQAITVNVTGTVNGTVQGNGTIPLSATAPRGQTTATDVPGPAATK
jgi:hypothetical protein